MSKSEHTSDWDDEDEVEVVPFHNGTQEVATVEEKPRWVLKKLTERHKRIAALKASGLSRTDIAQMCKCTPEYVTMLMDQPAIQALMQSHHRAIDQDLQDLTGAAVDTTRSMLASPDDKVKLSAAKLVLAANGKLSKGDDSGENVTAEDVVARIFAITNSNVQINVTPKES